MTNTTTLGMTVLLAALALGLLGDALLRATPWGVNAPLFAAAVLLAALAIARRQRVELVGGGRWLAPPALCFAGAFAWRDSAALIGFNLAALAVAATLFAFRARQGRVRVAGLLDYLVAAAHVGVHLVGGVLALLFEDVTWRSLPGGRPVRRALAVLGGLALAAPLLIVFGALPILVIPSRVYMGRHWPSDTIAAVALGTIWLVLTVALYQWGKTKAWVLQRFPDTKPVWRKLG
jgi:membrane-associated phospholipid phosphatase